MAATVSNASPQFQAVSLGNIAGRLVDVAIGTNEYVAGGIPVTSAIVGLSAVLGGIPVGVIGSDGSTQAPAYVPVYDHVNQKLILIQDSDSAADAVLEEVANGSNTAITVRVLVIGV